jgi:hypothetical protein
MPTRVEVVASNVLLGADSVEVDGTEPRPDDAVRGPCLDLVMRGSNPGMAGCIAPGDVVLAPRFSGAIDLGVVGPGLLGFPDSLPLPVN